MKPLNYTILFFLIFIVSCTTKNEITPLPFELQPKGLQKKIEVEVIEKMEGEVIAYMERQHSFYSMDDLPPICRFGTYNLSIKRNQDSSLFIRGQKDHLESISAEVVSHYQANANLSMEELEKFIQDKDYPYYSYPFYSWENKENIKQKVNESKRELALSKRSNDENLINFYAQALNELTAMANHVKILNVDKLPGISFDMEIIVDDAIAISVLSPLTKEVVQGIFQLRDQAAKKYFNESYLSLHFKSTHCFNSASKEKMAAIDYLYQMRVIDMHYAERNNRIVGFSVQPIAYAEK